jgi:hypothetical protein
MKTTRLLDKKLNNFLHNNSKNEFEIAVRKKLLYKNLKEKNGFIDCAGEDLWVVAYRSWFYGISIIGVESNIDQDFPFYDFCIEDYVEDVKNFGEKNQTQWIISALMPVVINHPGIQLKFYIDVPGINIPILKKTIEELA